MLSSPECGSEELTAGSREKGIYINPFHRVQRLLGISSTEPRAISTARLNMSPCLHLRPIDVVVCDGPRRDLISESASCLDAFSTYPVQTRLPGGAPGGTTGTPEVCPTRSSRTSVGSPQISTPTTDRDRTVSRRSEPSSLLGGISLLSPEYLLSFERRPFHAEPPDHYAQVSFLFDLSVSQSSTLMPLHSAAGCQSA